MIIDGKEAIVWLDSGNAAVGSPVPLEIGGVELYPDHDTVVLNLRLPDSQGKAALHVDIDEIIDCGKQYRTQRINLENGVAALKPLIQVTYDAFELFTYLENEGYMAKWDKAVNI